MKLFNFVKKFVSSFNEETKSNEMRLSLENLELIICTGSILDCTVDAIVNSLDSSLEFKSKLYF